MTASDIVSLAEAKDFLNIDVPTYDAELATFISAASQMWVRRVGPVAGSPTFDEWYDGGRDRIVLRNTPVQTITAVTESYGTSIHFSLSAEVLDDNASADAYGYSIDLASGVLVRRAMGVSVPFAMGVRNIHVTYTAGYATVPEDIKQAVKVLIGHMWETQRPSTRRPGMGSDGTPVSTSFTWPRRVQEIADGYLVPGIS